MVIIDLENAHDRMLRCIIQESLKAKRTLWSHIEAIQDVYDEASTNIHTPVVFLIRVTLHQGSILTSFPFAIIIYELSKSIWKIMPWYMIFTNDIVMITGTRRRIILN